MADRLETVELGAEEAQWSVIWLHGLGADGHDFEPIVPELRLPDSLAVRFIFPHAPVRPVTLNGGMPMRAWFDLSALSQDAPFDHEGYGATREAVIELIRRENERGVPTECIVLAGFSMGGAVSLGVGMALDEELAGIMGLSTFLFPAEKTGLEAHAANQDTPVFMAHGQYDPVVPIDFGKTTRRQVEEQGMTVEWHEYAMPHAVCPEEIAAISDWLKKRFA
ncbi:MAG: carboxylesterase [Gammaproteobacteria bacterium]|nr:carboxylesterase [Gammaproteobacteria bacterium]